MIDKSKYVNLSKSIVTVVAIFSATSAFAGFFATFTRSCNYTVSGTITSWGEGGGKYYNQSSPYYAEGSASGSAGTRNLARRKARDKIIKEQSEVFQQQVKNSAKVPAEFRYYGVNAETIEDYGAYGDATIRVTGDKECGATKTINYYTNP